MEECLELIERAKSSVLRKAEGILGSGGEEEEDKFYVMLRWSRPKWDGYETVDVVQLEWYSSYCGERKWEEKEKRSAKGLWDVLEEAARRMGRILRVECVLHQALINMLLNERHYRMQRFTDNCLLCV